MSLETHWRVIVVISLATVLLSVASYEYGDRGAPIIIIGAMTVLGVAFWAREGWNKRPRL